jgi:hypothetical protein
MLLWVRTSYGWEADAPYIEGSYIVQGAVGEGFVLTKFWDCARNGGQNQMEYEHPRLFKSLRSAKDWCQIDYDGQCGLTQ